MVMNRMQMRSSVHGRRVDWMDEADAWRRWAMAWFVLLLLTNGIWAVAMIAKATPQ